VADVQGDPNHGASLFAENCAMCHGAQGEGRIGATLAKDWPSIRPDLSIKNVVTNGVPDTPMVAWSKGTGGPLSDEDINDIVAYVLSLPKTNSPGGEPGAVVPAEELKAPAWVQGVIGVALFLVVLILVVGGVLLFQKRT
jgi:mono/diheme cytochrome c family protein